MYELAEGSSRPLKYEDIVVKAFSLYPQDFALRGYPKYPDSSDIHKPLYGPLKRAGYILAGNKQFRLTAKGIERGRALAGGEKSGPKKVAERLSRTDESELQRIYQCDAFQLFLEGKGDGILDTDFYAYLGVTVRTDRNEFLGRLKTVGDSVKAGVRILGDPRSTKTLELHEYLLNKFSKVIERMRADK